MELYDKRFKFRGFFLRKMNRKERSERKRIRRFMWGRIL